MKTKCASLALGCLLSVAAAAAHAEPLRLTDGALERVSGGGHTIIIQPSIAIAHSFTNVVSLFSTGDILAISAASANATNIANVIRSGHGGLSLRR